MDNIADAVLDALGFSMPSWAKAGAPAAEPAQPSSPAVMTTYAPERPPSTDVYFAPPKWPAPRVEEEEDDD